MILDLRPDTIFFSQKIKNIYPVHFEESLQLRFNWATNIQYNNGKH